MAAIEYTAREYTTGEAMLESYRVGHKRLWGKPVTNIVAEPPCEPEPDPPAPEPVREPEPAPEPIAVLIRPPPMAGKKACEVLARNYGLTCAELIGIRRDKRFIEARQIAYFILVRCIGYSFPQAGLVMGKRDHTTVLHGYYKIRGRMEQDESLVARVKEMILACELEIPDPL